MQNLNEVSARYTELPDEFYIPMEWRKQDVKNKQSSLAQGDWSPNFSFAHSPGNTKTNPTESLKIHNHMCYDLYQAMIKAGIAREMARMVLPVNIYTEIYACWDLKNLLHFITLREDAHAQAEIQHYGTAIKKICQELFPWTIEAYEKYKFTLIEKQ
jgi:thymidylate synthase (FAD)